MSNDNAYREFREAYSDVLADRHLDLPRLARLEHVPPELNGRILTAFWIGDSTGIDSPLGGGRCRLPILLIFEVG